MSGENERKTVGQLPGSNRPTPRLPAALTRFVWLLWLVSLCAVGVRLAGGGDWELSGLVVVDGLTLVMWVVVTFFSGIVHSYSRRYMAGSEHLTRFFTRLFAFTVVVMGLVAADHVAGFWLAWLVMGLVMADLVGTVRGWPQAQTAASYAWRYFLASSLFLGIALVTLSQATDATTVSGILAAVETVPETTLAVALGSLLLAAMIQSALVPFHTWLLSSMTAPTPASALMHAGFVNAGGVLFARFAPAVSLDGRFTLLVVVVGTVSALLGKLLKSVQTDIKGGLGCSTTGQMGFMLVQAGLGFFGAAVTHLVLHGFYKAHQFLRSGGRVEHTSPATESSTRPLGLVGGFITLLTAAAGGVVFALLTGKGTALDSGLLLTGLVVLTTLHATQTAVRRRSVPVRLRYGVVAILFLPAIAVYGAVYIAITGLMSGEFVTAPTDLTVVHVAVGAAFVVSYVAIETGLYRRSERLYVALLNTTQPPAGTVLTASEEYDEH
jgi:NAD(P)H-quinone oxidoreductase subunit 5